MAGFGDKRPTGFSPTDTRQPLGSWLQTNIDKVNIHIYSSYTATTTRKTNNIVVIFGGQLCLERKNIAKYSDVDPD